MNTYSDIDALLDGVVTLPSVPATLSRITELLDDPNISLSQVGKAISSDPGIAMKTMRLVNSASYGVGTEVVSIEHAVVMLGARVIKNLVITATALETMQTSSGEFLRHCVATGVAMRLLMEEGGPLHGRLASSDEAFIIGLLHDVGKLLLGEALPKHQTAIEECARTASVPWHVAEARILGVDHAALGGRLAAQWKLPAVFSEAIAAHHDLECCKAEHRYVAAGLALADYLAHACGLAWHAQLPFTLPPAVWEVLELKGADVLHLCERFFDSLSEVEEYLSFAR